MGFNYVKELISPEEIKKLYPLTEELKQKKAQRDEEIKAVFEGKDNRFLAIIGPCSADNEDAVCEYINRLADVQDNTYIEKNDIMDVECFEIRNLECVTAKDGCCERAGG